MPDHGNETNKDSEQPEHLSAGEKSSNRRSISSQGTVKGGAEEKTDDTFAPPERTWTEEMRVYRMSSGQEPVDFDGTIEGPELVIEDDKTGHEAASEDADAAASQALKEGDRRKIQDWMDKTSNDESSDDK